MRGCWRSLWARGLQVMSALMEADVTALPAAGVVDVLLTRSHDDRSIEAGGVDDPTRFRGERPAGWAHFPRVL
jgi:hypothetical protein